MKHSIFDYEVAVLPLDSSGICVNGLALEMKRRFPEAAREYQRLCIARRFNCGDLYAWQGEDRLGRTRYLVWMCIGGFPTLHTIEVMLKDLKWLLNKDDEVKEFSIGGLKEIEDWDEWIKPLLIKYFEKMGKRVYIVEKGICEEIKGDIHFFGKL